MSEHSIPLREDARAAAGLVLGCDIGGTFTDFVLYDPADGRFAIDKRLTTPRDPAQAVLAGADHLARSMNEGTSMAGFARVVHGTTLGINALLERKGATTAMVSTRGFRDVLELRRGARGELWDLSGQLPAPLVPRDLRFEVGERIDSAGKVLQPLDEHEVRQVLQACVDAGASAVGVCLLHAYVNAAHERAIGDLARRHFPGLSVSLSSDVLPQLGEFERTSATAANAYLRPVMERYLPRLEASLRERELPASGLRLLSSEGSQCMTPVALQFPIRVVESGPVGGVLAARHFAQLAGSEDVLTLDIGGTTAKTCLLSAGELPIAEEYEVARIYRFAPGSGLPLNVPSVDLLEIGAGGGSLAWIGPLGMVEIGPESAGADPGPACYGQGGTQPTLTDADVVLGLLDPESFRRTARPVDRALAQQAIERHIARPLGRTVTDAARLIRQVALQKMVGAVALQLAHVGADPRQLTLAAFGGAGPLYAVDLARALGIPRVIIPPMAAVFSALGMVMAPMAYTATRTLLGELDAVDPSQVASVCAELAALATEAVCPGAAASARPALSCHAELRFRGQGRSLRLELPMAWNGKDAPMDRTQLTQLGQRFRTEYAQRFGGSASSQALQASVQLTGLRVTAVLPQHGFASHHAPAAGAAAAAAAVRRTILAGTPDEAGCTVVARGTLAAGGDASTGPMLVEELGSTTFASGPARVHADAAGNLVIDL